MTTEILTDSNQFRLLCNHIREAGLVAFDTEFISEYTLYPELCLLQFATEEQCVAVDPFKVEDLSPWWEIMADKEITVVVHGGQAEVKFCLHEFGQRPQNLIDLQIAEGFRGRSYPLGYGALIQRVLGKNLKSGETRTDWKKRPLLDRQIRYALDDVKYVLPAWQQQKSALQKVDRLEWVKTECDQLIENMVQEMSRENWRRLSGVYKLKQRSLAAAIELSQWRDTEAKNKNRPLRQVLRDDLLMEIARKLPKKREDIDSIRDMNRRNYQRAIPEILDAVGRALALTKSELPSTGTTGRNEKNENEQVISQLLGIALSNRCAQMNVARQLVGTNTDLLDVIRNHYNATEKNKNSASLPRLLQGWRAEVCGNLMANVLNGKISMRVAATNSECPLIFEEVN